LLAVVNATTWPSAWTPASVRLEPRGTIASPVTPRIASASAPCTVARPG
jgi:hypothetical protein